MVQQDLWDGADVSWVGASRDDLVPGTRGVVVDAGRDHVSSYGTLQSRAAALVQRRGIVIRTSDGVHHRVRRGDVEVVAPDHPLRAEPDESLATWWLEQLWPWAGHEVATLVPAGLEAVTCVLHPWRGTDGDATWASVREGTGYSQELLRDHAAGFDQVTSSGQTWAPPEVGQLPVATVQVLVELLADRTDTPDDVFVGVWRGWGDVPPQRFPGAAEVATPARGHFLLRGPIDGVTRSVAVHDVGRTVEAGIWWPRDRAWFVCTEIDYAWTFVGGSAETVATLEGDARLETASVDVATPADRPD